MSTLPPNRRRTSTAPSAEPLEITDDDTGSGLPLPAVEIDVAQELNAETEAQLSDERRAKRHALRERLQQIASSVSMVALVVGSLVGGRFVHRWAVSTPRFGAHEIELAGNTRSTREDVLNASEIHEGRNVLSIDARRAETRLRALPWVSSAHVTRRLPGSVRIELEERDAAALLSASGLYLVATDGSLIKRLAPGDPIDLPMISGIDRALFAQDPELAKEHVRDALALLSDLAGSSLAGRVRADEVHRDATGDLSMTLSDRGIYVWMGRGPYRAKMARLSAILGELERNHLVAAEIHLESDRHPERAAVRLQRGQ
ncbi:MAG: FtsQ-type POTRA domain-containing protein [Deltaproteobacteria bacterium]|nr:FtsQ-type POTRA domain-containing protein [Deltaproteobacteria bacterium]